MDKKVNFRIRKGLETPLFIQGMAMKYFYIFSFVCGGMVLILIGKLMSLSRNLSFSNFVSFFVMLVFAMGVVVGLKVYFTNKSYGKGYKFNKRPIYLTNRDILNNL